MHPSGRKQAAAKEKEKKKLGEKSEPGKIGTWSIQEKVGLAMTSI